MQGIAVLPQGLEAQGAIELVDLGAKCVRPLRRSVAFETDLACFYRLHLQARLPFRLLREISRFACSTPEQLYQGVQSAFNWEVWLIPSMTFRVDVSGTCDGLPHSHFTALQVKNAIVDLQRQIWGERSSINLKDPDFCLHLHLNRNSAVLSLDGSGGSLHRRGYRAAMGIAPLKENLAAGLIRLSAWDGSVPLIDPLCGSATLLIEAVSLSMGLAPGLKRDFLFEAWPDFDSQVWANEIERARQSEKWEKKHPVIIGCEQDLDIANQAKSNVSSAGLENVIEIQNSDFRELDLPKQQGMLVCNPPYGKRIGQNDDLENLYMQLGSFTKENASGWHLWLLCGDPKLSAPLRMKSSKRFAVSNGGIDCRWLQYLIH